MSLYETLQIEYFVFGGASQVLWEVIKNSLLSLYFYSDYL